MPRTLPIILLLLACPAGPALAECSKEARILLNEALAIQSRTLPGQTEAQALDLAYRKMGEAALADPRCWEAFLHMGANRCRVVGVLRSLLEQDLIDKRARGQSAAEQENTRARGNAFIGQVLQRHVYENFLKMARLMKQQGEWDDDTNTFTRAATKFAAGEFLRAKGNRPGAIDEFKTLVKKDWSRKSSADFIARSYLRLGAEAFMNEKFAEAQEFWDKGLRWVQSPHIRRTLLTNKAGAFEMDNQFGKAGGMLRELIAAEPDRPEHWKNLGLVLGYQNRLHSALYTYRKCRNLCRQLSGRFDVALLHGNAWLKAAMIHGKLLETDGDLRTAWRLFLEYRAMFGDDYNFCLNFGEFCFEMGRYELAWTYLTKAAELQPFCPSPYQLLLAVAQRMTDGTPEGRKTRREQAKENLQRVREQYLSRRESPTLKRMCGGLRDFGDGRSNASIAPLIVPDPLAGETAGNAPLWIVDAADRREPHVPSDASVETFLAESAESDGTAPEAQPAAQPPAPPSAAESDRSLGSAWWHWPAVIAGAILAFIAALAVRRIRAT